MSARNNRERFSAPAAGAEAPPTPVGFTPESSGPLNFVVPTEFVELPSGGKFYPEGHPLHAVSEIEIKYMTAKEEDLLTSVTLIKKGIALERMLQNIIVDKRINIDDLLVGDKNAILIASRASAYGAEYVTKVTCPVCTAKTEHSFDLNERVIKEPVLGDDISITEAGTFNVTLPKTSAVVEVKLLTGHDEKKLSDLRQRRAKSNLGDLVLTDQLKAFVVSVNGVTTRGPVNEFIENLPAFDSKFLRTTYQKIMRNLDMKQDFECIVCGHNDRLEVPFNTEFFWPK